MVAAVLFSDFFNGFRFLFVRVADTVLNVSDLYSDLEKLVELLFFFFPFGFNLVFCSNT